MKWDRVTEGVRRHIDAELERAKPAAEAARPAKGWVNAIRRSLGMSERQLGERMGISQPSVSSLERSEADGTIRLSTLRRAAEALDCEVAYVLLPRRPLEELVAERARELARSELGRVRQSMALEAQDVELSDAAVEERARELIAAGRLWRNL